MKRRIFMRGLLASPLALLVKPEMAKGGVVSMPELGGAPCILRSDESTMPRKFQWAMWGTAGEPIRAGALVVKAQDGLFYNAAPAKAMRRGGWVRRVEGATSDGKLHRGDRVEVLL